MSNGIPNFLLNQNRRCITNPLPYWKNSDLYKVSVDYEQDN
jgi:hypothetical protein